MVPHATELGRRTLLYGADDTDEPFLYCRRPFENAYIDAEGKVYRSSDMALYVVLRSALAALAENQ